MSTEKLPENMADIELSVLGSRRLRVFFYTSNINKYLQARHVFARFGYVLEHFPQHAVPYNEDYSGGKDALLARAVQEVEAMVGRGFLFFVEDTSLRIEALSTPTLDFPGLQVKEWFASTTFTDLDKELRAAGGNRRATIKSGIALHLPGRPVPVYFHGETLGTIATSPPSFSASPIHPWLSANTFDGWFLPDGSGKRLGEMTADESMRLHFRAKALRLLVERVTEYLAILNTPSTAYFVHRSSVETAQGDLFPSQRVQWVIVGPRAAGKTTFGEYAATIVGAQHFEASMVIRSYHRELASSEQDLTKFANELHAQLGDDLVVRTLVDKLGFGQASTVVVSGLRKFEELAFLEKSGIDYRLIYIDASARTRYDRYVQRAREHEVMTFDQFVAQGDEQSSFFRFAKRYADLVIENEFSLAHYLLQIEFILRDTATARPQGVQYRKSSLDTHLSRSLSILADEGGPLSPEEIAKRLLHSGVDTRPDSIVRAFRAEPNLCRQVPATTGEQLYELTVAGEAFIRILRNRIVAISSSNG